MKAAEGRRSKAEGTRPDSVMAPLLSHKTPGFLSHSNLPSGYLLEKKLFCFYSDFLISFDLLDFVWLSAVVKNDEVKRPDMLPTS